jgi:site-specific DNA-adenine methylase
LSQAWRAYVVERLQGVQFCHPEALELTLFYLDPPYLHATRTAQDVYAHEMSDEDHERLLETITSLEGIVLSLDMITHFTTSRCVAGSGSSSRSPTTRDRPR